MSGRREWIVPDCWLPPAGGDGDLVNHESLMILNTSDEDAEILIDLYFEDREPVLGLKHSVGAHRIRAIRLDQAPDLKFEVPRATQYALRVRSSVPVSVQYGRMDVRQPNLAYYCTMAFPAD